MKNPLKFIQEVKQETFRISWPTKKDTMMGAVMVFALASIAAVFFLILDQILRFLLNLVIPKLLLLSKIIIDLSPFSSM